MIIRDDRSELDAALEDGTFRLMVLFSDEGSRPGLIYEILDRGDWEDWHCLALVTDSSVLSADEGATWQPSGEDYVALGGDDRQVTRQGDDW